MEKQEPVYAEENYPVQEARPAAGNSSCLRPRTVYRDLSADGATVLLERRTAKSA
jgi:hypothetical protein